MARISQKLINNLKQKLLKTDERAVSMSTLRLSITFAPPTQTACHGTRPANHYSDTLQAGVKPPFCFTDSVLSLQLQR